MIGSEVNSAHTRAPAESRRFVVSEAGEMGATENAIDEAITAHAAENEYQGVIVGWIVLAATLEHDGGGDRSGVVTIYPGGSMQWPMALGIIEAARIKMHADFARGEP